MKYKMLFLILILLVNTGCSSSSNSDSAIADQTSALPQDPVHIIQPEDVAAYVERFREQRPQVLLELDGVQYPLVFFTMDEEANALFATYSGGLVQIGFDLVEEEPLPLIAVFEGDTTLLEDETFFNNLNRTLVGDPVDLGEDDSGNIIYSGRLLDASTQEQFDVRLVLNESLLEGGTSTLVVSGNDAMLNGDLGTSTYIQIQELISSQPQVTRLVMQEISGSVNDAINMHTGRLVRSAGLSTYVPADGDVNSGGVDMFAAGTTRSVEQGGILGVHSWCCEDGVTADQLPREHPAHRAQLTYFREMLADKGEDFYFFTLAASPFTSVHPMTREEMQRFDVITP